MPHPRAGAARVHGLKLLKRGELVTLKRAGFDATETHAADIARAASRFLLRN